MRNKQGKRNPRRLLVTGGAGFIGTNFVQDWSRRYPNDSIVILDALTHPGSSQNLDDLETDATFRFVQGDICDRLLVDALLKQVAIDTVVHLAAASQLDGSTVAPDALVRTNVVGTLTLIEAFRQHWLRQQQPDFYRFLQVSTDHVFGSFTTDAPPVHEATPYAPRSPYAASKAGGDHLVRAYFYSYGLPTLVTHSSHIYGPYDLPHSLIPRTCVNILLGKPLPITGDVQQMQAWLYVKDYCQGLDRVIHHGKPGETYSMGGDSTVKNLELVEMLCTLMDELAPDLPIRPSRDLITVESDHDPDDRGSVTDTSKIKRQLGWEPQVTLAEGLRLTAEWYLTNRDWWKPLLKPDSAPSPSKSVSRSS